MRTKNKLKNKCNKNKMDEIAKQIIKKKIKHRNRAIESRETKSEKQNQIE